MSSSEQDKPIDDRLVRDAERLLRQGAEDLDAATLARLHRARQQALAELDRHARRPSWLQPGWRPAAGVAVVAVLAVALWIGRMSGPAAPEPQSAKTPAGTADSSDLDLVLAEENLEMLEDLEFFDWIEAGMPGAANGAGDISG